MIAAAIASYLATPKQLHEANNFSFAPLKEVGWLFFGIFFTMVPVLDFMRFHAATIPIDSPAEFYWLSGALSSVLDNAPTYLAFLANAMGRHELSVESAAHVRAFLDSSARELVAISLGSAFFGAGTYIGNSPNFMVKAIVDHQKAHAPTFFGFVFKFAVPVLLPVLYLIYLFEL